MGNIEGQLNRIQTALTEYESLLNNSKARESIIELIMTDKYGISELKSLEALNKEILDVKVADSRNRFLTLTNKIDAQLSQYQVDLLSKLREMWCQNKAATTATLNEVMKVGSYVWSREDGKYFGSQIMKIMKEILQNFSNQLQELNTNITSCTSINFTNKYQSQKQTDTLHSYEAVISNYNSYLQSIRKVQVSSLFKSEYFEMIEWMTDAQEDNKQKLMNLRRYFDNRQKLEPPIGMVLLNCSCPPSCECGLKDPKQWFHTCDTKVHIREDGFICCENVFGKQPKCKEYFIQNAGFKCQKSRTKEKFRKATEFLMALAQAAQAAEFGLGDQDKVAFVASLNTSVMKNWQR